jgi:hypothetical protein
VTVASTGSTPSFSESCRTLVVNPQGCGVRLSRPLPVGIVVRLEGLPGGNPVLARVGHCSSLGKYEKSWLVGLVLDEPGNVWGVQAPPEDWR